jgi:FkbM family methyltransferase
VTLVTRANGYLRGHPLLAQLARRVTRPARHVGVPVLRGPARGMRVSVGDSTMTRLVSRVEPEVEDALLSSLRPGDALWDVGANIGWFGLIGARAVGPQGSVTAFEPNPGNAAQIAINAARNDVSISVVGAAVGREPGWAHFDTISSLTGRLSDTGTTIVPVVTMDAWAAEHGAPAVIKLDIEGSELAALAGAERLLATSRPVILCECHGTQIQVDRVLRAAGYDVRAVEMPDTTIENVPPWAHLLATPR